MKISLRTRSLLLALGPLLAVACKGAGDDAAESDLALVSTVQCSIARGAFVPAKTAPGGELTVTCPGVRGVMFNGEAVPGETLTAFKVKPHEGVNILHVEQGDPNQPKTADIPFLYGNFADANTMNPHAIVVRAGAAGLSSNGALNLPLPAGPTPLTLSQFGTQYVRDQGNVLSRFDGSGADVSGIGFRAKFNIVKSSYDPQSLSVVVTPRAGGLHIDAQVSNIASTFAWDAGLTFFQFHDTVDASIAKAVVSADINLAYDQGSKKLKASLGPNHDVHVENITLDSAALNRVPVLGKPIEEAIAAGAEVLFNSFADPILDLVRDHLGPQLALSLEQFKLPSEVTIPKLGGPLKIAQAIDGATFEADATQLSLIAKVAAANPNAIAAPGFLTRPVGAPSFDTTRAFGASLSVDYVNQALFASWKQGLLNRALPALPPQFGITLDNLSSDAKLPPVLFPRADGKGIDINVGELHLTAVYHSATFGDAKVKFAISVLAGANLQLGPGGETIIIKPTKDEAHTKFVAELIGVQEGSQDAADEIAGGLKLFTPVIESMIANDFDIPPVAIPAVDLGAITPGFKGRSGRFDGAVRFDAATNRIAVDGELIAH